MRRLAATAVAAAALVAAGCGSETKTTPVACTAGTAAYLKALADAPGEVRLEGTTPISDCFTSEQSGGQIANVGGAVVAAATQLNRAALADPSGPEPGRLGFLVGAVSVGVAKTGGIHTELLRRVRSAARFNEGRPLPPPIRAAYAKGYAAGRRHG
jgi:hypothetical protein